MFVAIVEGYHGLGSLIAYAFTAALAAWLYASLGQITAPYIQLSATNATISYPQLMRTPLMVERGDVIAVEAVTSSGSGRHAKGRGAEAAPSKDWPLPLGVIAATVEKPNVALVLGHSMELPRPTPAMRAFQAVVAVAAPRLPSTAVTIMFSAEDAVAAVDIMTNWLNAGTKDDIAQPDRSH